MLTDLLEDEFFRLVQSVVYNFFRFSRFLFLVHATAIVQTKYFAICSVSDTTLADGEVSFTVAASKTGDVIYRFVVLSHNDVVSVNLCITCTASGSGPK